MINVHPYAEPFKFKGNTNAALLLIHGFTASPSEVYPVARMVYETNSCTISGILLPGHGSSPISLNGCTWIDWYRAVEIELHYLLESYERVYVGGLSMGALLAMYAGINHKVLKGIIAINAPIYNKNPILTSCAPMFSWLRPYYPKKIDQEMLKLEKEGRFAYRVMPVKAFQSLMKLRRNVMHAIQDLDMPMLVIQSLRDESVDARSGKYLYEKTRASSLIELKESRHIASMGPEKERITQEIVTFMAAH